MPSITAITGTAVNTSIPGVIWQNPTRVQTDDGDDCQVTFGAPAGSDYLDCTNFDFSAIPDGSTIDGIEVICGNITVQHTGRISDTKLNLRLSGADKGSGRAGTVYTSLGPVDNTNGGSTDLWGTTWTVADIKDSSFGVRWQISNNLSFSYLRVQSVKIRVHYTEPTPIQRYAGVTDQGTADGLSFANRKNFNDVLADLTTNDTLDVEEGEHHIATDAQKTLTSLYGVTIRPYSGNTGRARIRGDILIDHSTTPWTKTGGRTNVYQATIGSSLTLTYAMVGFDSTDYDIAPSTGNPSSPWETTRKANFLKSVADVATVDTTPGSYYYDSGTGVIYVRATTAGTADLTTDTEQYSYQQGSGGGNHALTLDGCTNCTIEDIDYANFSQPGGDQSGSSVYLKDCENCTVDGGSSWNSGRHCLTCIQDSNNCSMSNHIAIGGMSGSAAAENMYNPFVIAASGTANISGNTFTNLGMHYYPCLHAEDQTPVEVLSSGCYLLQVHDGATYSVDDLQATGCWMVGYNDADSSSYFGQYISLEGGPGSWTDDGTEANFPFIVEGPGAARPAAVGFDTDARATFVTGFLGGGGTTSPPTLLKRCNFMQKPNFGSNFENMTMIGRMRIQACVFYIDNESKTNSRGVLFVVKNATGNFLQLYCNTFYGDNLVANSGTLIPVRMENDANGTLDIKGNLFANDSSGANHPSFIYMGAGTTTGRTATVVSADSNWYYNFATAAGDWMEHLTQDADYNSQAEWSAPTTGIDPSDAGGVYGTDPQLQAPSEGNLKPANDSVLHTTLHSATGLSTIVGIDGATFSGRYGAYQGEPVEMAAASSSGRMAHKGSMVNLV